jgi:hypothetical protein
MTHRIALIALALALAFVATIARSGPENVGDGVMEELLTVSCEPGLSRLKIEVQYVDDIEGLHDPQKGKYDISQLAHRKETGPGPRDYENSVETFEQKCVLSGDEFEVVIEGYQWAGSPMQECGIGNSATVAIYRKGRQFLPKTLLDDCFEHDMPPISSIVIDLKRHAFRVVRDKYL